MLIAALIALAVACLTVAFPDWPAVVACEYRQLGRRRRERQRDDWAGFLVAPPTLEPVVTPSGSGVRRVKGSTANPAELVAPAGLASLPGKDTA